MMYDDTTGKGKKYESILPKPNPCKVEVPRQACLQDIYAKAKELYFKESSDCSRMCLADSSGMIIKIDNQQSWTLEKYFHNNDFHPSRHKIFVVLNEVIIHIIQT